MLRILRRLLRHVSVSAGRYVHGHGVRRWHVLFRHARHGRWNDWWRHDSARWRRYGPRAYGPSFPSCAVSTNPSSLTNNGSSTVTVNYNNFQGTPNGNVVCSDGQSVAPSCTGNNQGSCTATCTYSKPATLPAHYIVSSTLNGITCRNGGINVAASSIPARFWSRL